jgi:hypothetical protein
LRHFTHPCCDCAPWLAQHSDRYRFLPTDDVIRARILSAIRLGSEAYAAELEQRLHVLEAPWDRFPTALMPLVLEYVLRLDRPKRRKEPQPEAEDTHDEADALVQLALSSGEDGAASSSVDSSSSSSSLRNIDSLDEDERRKRY